MKQIIVLLLIIGGGYYLYNNGLSDVLRKANLDPKDFVEGVKEATGGTVGGVSKAAELPEIAPERASGPPHSAPAGNRSGSQSSFRRFHRGGRCGIVRSRHRVCHRSRRSAPAGSAAPLRRPG